MNTEKTDKEETVQPEKVDEKTKFGQFILAKRALLAPYKMQLIIENKLLEGPDGAEITKKALELKNLIDKFRADPDDEKYRVACQKALDEYEPAVKAVFKKKNVKV